MILQALARYYDYLLEHEPDEIPRPGWCERPVTAKLELDTGGNLVNVVPAPEKRGWRLSVPEQAKRASGICANLLCDTSGYLLGMDAKGKPERTAACHAASVARHEAALEGVDSVPARAVLRFLRRWDPAEEAENPLIAENAEALLAGKSLVFAVDGEDVLDDPAIRRRVEEIALESSDSATRMVCLVSGEEEPIARLHPAIKGVTGAQSTGASLVSFNARAFESFSREDSQGLNSPVGARSAFAYATALNHLLSRPDHRMRLGDTTVVFWAEREDEECSNAIARLLGNTGLSAQMDTKASATEADRALEAIMRTVRRGTLADAYDVDAPFYVLGLAPNAGRLAVRFFWSSRFGDVVENLARHYERTAICHAPFEREHLTPYQLVHETENPHATHHEASSELAGALMRSILADARYPESLYENVLLRIRATTNDPERHVRKVTRGRAAIVRAHLIKNAGKSEKEVTMSLNEDKSCPAYVLGRIFATLEEIQDAANPSVNTTIADKYFDSASATPAAVFPIIIKLAKHHLEKLDRDKPGFAVALRKQLGGLIDRLDEFPKRLSVEDQGEFILGYYQQNQRRYEKKAKEA